MFSCILSFLLSHHTLPLAACVRGPVRPHLGEAKHLVSGDIRSQHTHMGGREREKERGGGGAAAAHSQSSKQNLDFSGTSQLPGARREEATIQPHVTSLCSWPTWGEEAKPSSRPGSEGLSSCGQEAHLGSLWLARRCENPGQQNLPGGGFKRFRLGQKEAPFSHHRKQLDRLFLQESPHLQEVFNA